MRVLFRRDVYKTYIPWFHVVRSCLRPFQSGNVRFSTSKPPLELAESKVRSRFVSLVPGVNWMLHGFPTLLTSKSELDDQSFGACYEASA